MRDKAVAKVVRKVIKDWPEAMPPNFKLPKRCEICKFCGFKGWLFLKRYCKKYNIRIGGIGCCDSYLYMTDKDE